MVWTDEKAAASEMDQLTVDDGELAGLVRAREAIKSYIDAQGMYAHARAPYEKCIALINEIIARDFGADNA